MGGEEENKKKGQKGRGWSLRRTVLKKKGVKDRRKNELAAKKKKN